MSLRCWFSEAAPHRCFSKQLFLKISQYSQKAPALAFAGLLLQKTYCSCFWIFAAATTFFSWIWYLLLTVATVFAPTPLKTQVEGQKQPLKLFCIKGILRNFASFSGKHPCWSLFLRELQTFRPAALLKRDSNIDVFLWNLQNF